MAKPEKLKSGSTVMANKHKTASNQTLRLYRDLADWYPLLTPVSDYEEEAAFYRRLFDAHCQRPPRTLLDLGCGGGHNAAHLKATLACTLVDREPAMLALSRRLNPECEHIQGDMRSISLGRVFDCVLVHDAVSYMTSRTDLESAIVTSFKHTAAGGVAMFQPDFVSETFRPSTETGGSDGNGRGLRYLEWRWIPDSKTEMYVTDMAYLLRDVNGAAKVIHDRHFMGLFPRAVWVELISSVGFEPLVVPFEHSSVSDTGFEVFLGLRPAAEAEK